MIELCVDKLMYILEYLTDHLIKDKNPPLKPVVGEPPLLRTIADVNKGNFVVFAHAGAGKTTLGLLLYHKSRYGELFGYKVIYANARQLRELTGSPLKEETLIEAMFHENSSIGEKARVEGVILSTADNLTCKKPYECIKGVYQQKAKIIIVIDELERALEWELAQRHIINWFIATRKFYDETFAIPIKVVVTLPKVLHYINTLHTQIRLAGGEATYVFTEFREHAITSNTLRDYFNKLNLVFGQALANLHACREFRQLIEILGSMVSGRFSIPLLRKAISLSICRSLQASNFNAGMLSIENINSTVSTIAKFISNKQLEISVADVIDPVLQGIVEGKPFKAYDRKSTVLMWEEAISSLCKDLGSITGAIKYGYQNFICMVNVNTIDTPILWFTLEKNLGADRVDAIVSKLMETLASRGRRFTGAKIKINLLVLVPKFTHGLIAGGTRPLSLQLEEKRREGKARKVEIELVIKQRPLGVEELISLAYKGNSYLQIDSQIAETIYEELKEELKSPASWQ